MTRSILALSFTFVGGVAALLGWLGADRSAPAPAPIPSGSRASFAEIVERVNPAVVHVAVSAGPGAGSTLLPADHPGGDRIRRGEGSGFVVGPDGYILTNDHVVASQSRIRVRLADNRELAATLVGSDPSTDIALLKVEASGLPVLALGDSDELRVGDWVCAIGNPYRFDHTVTVGVVSSKGRKIFDLSFDAYIQTDAAINPGNSGGPLIDAAGRVVGINSAVTTQGQGIGFAIPVNVAREVMQELLAHGRVNRGYLGVELQELDADLQKLLGLPEPSGALVVDVHKGEPGDKAGLKRYDVITAVSDRPVANGDQLVRAISGRPPGSPVELRVIRDGQRLALEARLGDRSSASRPQPPSPEPAAEPAARAGDRLGLEVAALSSEIAEGLKVPRDRRGVVVQDVVGLSPGADALAHGDLIVEVNRRPTPDLQSYRHVVDSLENGERVWLFVYRPRPPRSSFLTKLEVEAQRPQ